MRFGGSKRSTTSCSGGRAASPAAFFFVRCARHTHRIPRHALTGAAWNFVAIPMRSSKLAACSTIILGILLTFARHQAAVIRWVLAARYARHCPRRRQVHLCLETRHWSETVLLSFVSPLIAFMQSGRSRAAGIPAAVMHGALDASERTKIWNLPRGRIASPVLRFAERLRSLAPKLTTAGIRPRPVRHQRSALCRRVGPQLSAELPNVGLLTDTSWAARRA